MNKKIIKYISSLSITCILGTSIGLGINHIVANSKISNESNKNINSIKENNKLCNIKDTRTSQSTEVRPQNITVSSNLTSISAQEALVNEKVNLKNLLKINAFDNLPSDANVENFEASFSNISGEIYISSITVSKYNDESGNTISQSQTFSNIHSLTISGFKTITSPTEANTKTFTWEDNSQNVYDVNDKQLLAFFRKNKNEAFKNTSNDTNISKVIIDQRLAQEGIIKISLEITNSYQYQNNDYILVEEPRQVLGYQITGFAPTEDKENSSSSSDGIQWWVWLAIGLGAALLIILLIVIIVLIVKKKKKEKLQKSRSLNRTVNTNSKLALSNSPPNNQQNRLTNNPNNTSNNNVNNKPGQAQPNQNRPQQNINNNDPSKKPTQQQPSKPTVPPPPPIKVNAPPKSLAPKRVVKK